MDIAVYDACVLFSAPLRDLLLRLSAAKIVLGCWSNEIHEEWIRSLLEKRRDLSRERLEQTRHKMDTHAEGCLIEGYADLIPTLELPDVDDRHVLAAAIHAGASYIVTHNTDDFPASALEPYKIEAMTPDKFIAHLLVKDTGAVLAAIKRQRENLKNPPKTVQEHLATLEKQRLPKTVALLRKHETEI